MLKINAHQIIYLVIIISLISCKTDSNNKSKKETSFSANGAWESIGHGYLLEIRDSTSYSFYDATSISCVPRRTGKFKDIEKTILHQNDTLVLLSGTINYYYTPLESLPKLCKSTLNGKKAKDPLYNFDVFSETINEHYAFLELNNINWSEISKKQRAKLNSKSTRAELYLIIEESFELLNDNHAHLEAPNEVYDEIDEFLGPEDVSTDGVTEYGDFPTAKLVADHHILKDLTKDSWLMNWGMMENEMGYIQVKSMWLYADFDMPKSLVDSLGFVGAYVNKREQIYEVEYMYKEVEGVSKIMERVMKDLANTKAIVIDVRFNGGGQDLVSHEILRHFNPESKQVAEYKFRYGDKHTSALPVILPSSSKAYTNDVFVLTSPQSGSAAEMFAMATMDLAHIKRIGSATEGALSTTLDKKLPIGWDFSLSNQIYMDGQGKFYENIGIPVDYELNYSRDRQTFFGSVIQDLDKDKNDILMAIENINKK